MQVGEMLRDLTAPQAVALVDLVVKAGGAIVHRLAEHTPEDLAALRSELEAVVISDTDAAVAEGQRQAGAGG